MSVPAVLVLVAVALLAVAALAPRPARALPVVSLAPPAPAFPVERWSPPEREPSVARWPERIDPRARGCDAGARLALVEALAAARGAWAGDLLRAARDDEPEPEVRAAILAALAQLERM